VLPRSRRGAGCGQATRERDHARQNKPRDWRQRIAHKASSSLASVMQCDDAPYDAKVIGDYTGLTPPFGFED
jgi:hypothetical protein